MYSFEHIAKNLRGEEVMDITVNLPNDDHTATDLVENFVYFLQGCGFMRESILSALIAQTEELQGFEENAPKD